MPALANQEKIINELQNVLSNCFRHGNASHAAVIPNLINRYFSLQKRDQSEPHKTEAGSSIDLLSEFFYTLWSILLDSVTSGGDRSIDIGVQIVALLQNSSQQSRELPFLGLCVREIYNEPIDTTEFESDTLLSPAMQKVLAGVHPIPDGKDFRSLAEQRQKWLALQRFLARLWAECRCDEYALYAIWAVRDGLENWPESPPAIDSKLVTFETSPAYLAFNIEAALVWIRTAGHLMYEEKRVWGPNGDPQWPARAGAPGRGGKRWDGVDGYDAGHRRWELWRGVLQAIVAWYEAGVSEGTMEGWTFGEIAKKALIQMQR